MPDIFASLDPDAIARRRLEQRFRDFDRKNPQVFDWFVRFAKEIRRTGRKRFSADAIMHRVRWEVAMIGKGADGYKINNNHVRFYAHKLIEEYPEFSGFFEFRRSPGTAAEEEREAA